MLANRARFGYSMCDPVGNGYSVLTYGLPDLDRDHFYWHNTNEWRRIAAENLSFRGEAVGIRTPLTDFPRNDKDERIIEI